MNFRFIFNIFGRVLMLLGAFMLSSIIWALVYHEDVVGAFVLSSLITLVCGAAMYLLTIKNLVSELSLRDSYFTVTFVWVVFSLFGALPYLLSGSITSFTDALFETVSGFTTTGSSIISDVEALPKSILFWRSLTHWIGGMGIIVLVVAIMPLLRIGGYNLFKSETSGMTQEKLSPKTTSTAKRLWAVYVVLTFILIGLLLLGDMSFFDAINHAFSTMATGGFSTKNTSVSGFSSYSQYVIAIFMFLAGMNFYLHYHFYKGRFKRVFSNIELRTYFAVVVVVSLLITITVIAYDNRIGVGEALRNALFQVISVITTTGFATHDYHDWPHAAWMLLFVLLFSGACVGSTGGGIKIIRHVVAYRHVLNYFKRTLHPNSVSLLKIGGEVIDDEKVGGLVSFMLLYMLTFSIGTVLMVFLGSDLLTSAAAVASNMGGVGSGIGSVGAFGNYSAFSDASKILLSLLMLIGRLELTTVLILFTRIFWKG